jgi:hypothetical protein
VAQALTRLSRFPTLTISKPIVGPIEAGVNADLRKLGILEASSALETTALALARILDGPSAVCPACELPLPVADARSAAGLSRELRLTMEAIASQPEPNQDDVEKLAEQCQETAQ